MVTAGKQIGVCRALQGVHVVHDAGPHVLDKPVHTFVFAVQSGIERRLGGRSGRLLHPIAPVRRLMEYD